MPTILDELVLRFTIDTKNLDAKQQKALDDLRKLEEGAKRSAGNVKASGSGIVSFFRQLEHPMAALRQHFEAFASTAAVAAPKKNLASIGAQARRTGNSVAAGAAEGAAGLRALGVAGLAAFAVVKGLSAAMSGASTNAQKVFGVGLGSASSGVPVREMSAVALALNRLGNVPKEDTISWMAKVGQFQQNALSGLGWDQATATQLTLASGGDIDILHDSPTVMLQKLAKKFAGFKTDREAISFGGQAGLTEAQSLALRKGGPDIAKNFADARNAVTDKDVKSANDLLNAQNKMQQAWDRLYMTLWRDLTPVLIKVDNFLEKIADILNRLFGGEGDPSINPGTHPLGAPAVAGFSKIMKWLGVIPEGAGTGGGGVGGGTGGGVTGTSAPGKGDPAMRAALDKSNISPEGKAFLYNVYKGETAGYENPFGTLAGGGSFDPSQGYPNWPGIPSTVVPGARSHGAGAFQNERGSARWIKEHGFGFDAQGQLAGNWAWAQHVYADATHGRSLQDDIKNKTLNEAGLRALGVWGHGQWVRGASAARAAANGSGVPASGNSNSQTSDSRAPIIPPGTSAADAARIVQKATAGWTAGSSGTGQQSNNVHVDNIHVHTTADTATGIAAAGLMATDGSKIVSQANTGYV